MELVCVLANSVPLLGAMVSEAARTIIFWP